LAFVNVAMMGKLSSEDKIIFSRFMIKDLWLKASYFDDTGA